MQRSLVILGLTILVVGFAWPWLTRIGLGRLPGDFRMERDGFTFFFPLATSLIVSVVLSLLFWLFRR
ncbi:MAG: DUF2905 domain-containing protein [Chromatiales bacterium]|jgi:hypothetical protein|nr:DUF2905 domain-containing protein [Chromatiales bacterium]